MVLYHNASYKQEHLGKVALEVLVEPVALADKEALVVTWLVM
jgi:hypothetical protein